MSSALGRGPAETADLDAGLATLHAGLARLGCLELEDRCGAVLTDTLPPAPEDDVAVPAVRAHQEQDGAAAQPREEHTR